MKANEILSQIPEIYRDLLEPWVMESEFSGLRNLCASVYLNSNGMAQGYTRKMGNDTLNIHELLFNHEYMCKNGEVL